MIQAYIDFWSRGFDFKGRSSRPEFWWPWLLNQLLYLALLFCIVIYTLAHFSGKEYGDWALFGLIFSFLSHMEQAHSVILIFSALLIIPNLSLQMRRLRDAGFRPEWAYIALAGPCLYLVRMLVSGLETELYIISIIENLFSMGNLALIIMSCMPTKGETRTTIN